MVEKQQVNPMTTPDANPSWISKFFGISSFSMALAVPVGGGSDYQLRALAYINSYLGRHSLWPVAEVDFDGLEQPRDLDPQHALQFLCDNWSEIAGPFVEGGSVEAVIDLSGLFKSKTKPVIMTRKGPYIGFDFSPLYTDAGGESVVIVECLLQLGDLLAKAPVDPLTVARWRDWRKATDLLPFGIETEFGRYEEPEAVAYFSRILGLNREDYIRWAVFAHADHQLWAYRDSEQKLRPEPRDSFFEDPRKLPDALPHQATVDKVLAEAAEECGQSVTNLWEEAVDIRNTDARQVAIYGRWYPKERHQRETGFSGSLKAAIFGKFVDLHPIAFLPSGEKAAIRARLLPDCDPRSYVTSGPPLILTGLVHFEDGKPVMVDVSEVDVDKVREEVRRLLADVQTEDEGGR
jgi:hypothetical protein